MKTSYYILYRLFSVSDKCQLSSCTVVLRSLGQNIMCLYNSSCSLITLLERPSSWPPAIDVSIIPIINISISMLSWTVARVVELQNALHHSIGNHTNAVVFGPGSIILINLNPPLHFKVISVTYLSTVLNQYFIAEYMVWMIKPFFQLKWFTCAT